MRLTYRSTVLAAALFLIAAAMAVADPLPSWNDTAPKKAIVAFVERVTKEGSSDFVKPEERISTFDNDGTLWVEYENENWYLLVTLMDNLGYGELGCYGGGIEQSLKNYPPIAPGTADPYKPPKSRQLSKESPKKP
jgi:hypothetical protein